MSKWPGLGKTIRLGHTRGTYIGANSSRLAKYLSLPGIAGNYASTPDSPALDIVGDIDIRVKVSMNDWTPGALSGFISKRIGGNSYAFRMENTDLLTLVWFEATVAKSAGSSIPLVIPDEGILWVRATLDVDNGAAGNDTIFYTSLDGITWVQLGATLTQAGVTSIDSTAAAVSVGSIDGVNQMLAGEIFYAEIRNGINGPVVASFDPTRALTNQTQIQSAQGEVWTINKSGSGQIAQLF